MRAGIDHQRVPYITGQALRGVYLIDLTSTVLARAMTYRVPRLGSLDTIPSGHRGPVPDGADGVRHLRPRADQGGCRPRIPRGGAIMTPRPPGDVAELRGLT